MKLKSNAPSMEDWERTAHMSTDESVSFDGKPVLVIDGPDGGPVGPSEAQGKEYEIIEATEEELIELQDGGYYIPFKGKDGWLV
jgi:hypothetical protein